MLLEGQKFEKFIIEFKKYGPNQIEDSYSKFNGN